MWGKKPTKPYVLLGAKVAFVANYNEKAHPFLAETISNVRDIFSLKMGFALSLNWINSCVFK